MNLSTLFRTKENLNLDKNTLTILRYIAIFGQFIAVNVVFFLPRFKISNKTNLFGYKNSDLGQFNLANIELLIKKKLLQKNLIKPIYLS